MADKPAFRIVAKAKDGGGNHEVGVLWPSKIEGSFNARVNLTGKAPLPKDLQQALETLDKYWLNVFPNTPKPTDF